MTGRFVVLGVTFQLTSDQRSRPVRYAELARALGLDSGHADQAGRDQSRPDEGGWALLGDVRSAVLRLRRGKGMVLGPR